MNNETRNTLIARFEDPETWMYELFAACYRDVACASDISSDEAERDLKRIRLRLDKEGASFLTRTLPRLGKDLDQILSKGHTEQILLNEDVSTLAADTVPFLGFAKKEDDVHFPKLFGELFSRVLYADGRERSDASPDAFARIRQLCSLFYKLALPSTEEQNNEVIEKFCQTEEDLPDENQATLDDLLQRRWPFVDSDQLPYRDLTTAARAVRGARALCARVLNTVDPLDVEVLKKCRHGRGSVATGEAPHEKAVFKRYIQTLHDVYPYDSIMSFNLSHTCDEWRAWQGLESWEAGTAKVVLVPKDSRGPRLISCEPLELQWAQQAQMQTMVELIESHSLTRGKVNFEDQTINRHLALRASMGATGGYVYSEQIEGLLSPLTTEYVTMDMKDASDRVSLWLLRQLFPERWMAALKATRSTSTRLPDGRVIPLKKFAPMGSATCFPTEALVFWALAQAVLDESVQNGVVPVGTASVFVYGDDIILPRAIFGQVKAVLEYVHLKVNVDKCCTGKYFRESCGMDAYKGIDVTPLKIKAVMTSELVGTTLFSWCDYHNWFSRRGYSNAAAQIREWLENLGFGDLLVLDESLYYPVPFAYLHCAGEPAATTLSGDEPLTRKRKRYQRVEVRGYAVEPIVETHWVPGWSEMLYRASSEGDDRPEHDWEQSEDRPLWALKPKAKAYQYTRARRVIRTRAWLPLIKR